MMRRWLLPLSILALFAVRVAAQTPDLSPHGDLDVRCEVCHDASSWTVPWPSPSFDHATTGYVLTGRHAQAACSGCHQDLRFRRVASACADCHLDVHRRRFGARCDDCHDTSGWDVRDASRAAHPATGFPLLGAHAMLDCDACHQGSPGEEHTTIPADCLSCHDADYEATRDPDHAANGFSTDCVSCHGMTASGWGSGSFIHSPAFPLTGAHAAATCASCHATGYAGTPTDCYGCHRPDYEGTTDPGHVAAGFSTDCRACHNDVSWDDADFDHASSGFPLTGAHTTTTCVACHASGYTGTPTDCYACHRPDYEGTDDPGHVAAGFSTDCRQCHSDVSWDGADFDHATSGFALTGAHVSVSCASCHATGYTGTPTDCYACHRPDYEGTNDPDHVAAGYSTDCRLCHSDASWEGADFDHTVSGFPLTGAHTTTTCISCHASGYSGTPADCYACHRPDYEAATEPGHVAAGFNTQCASCHTTSVWQPANWNHDTLFPIYSGRHRNEWNACVDCHVTPTNYAVFECIFCHEHNRTETDQQHQGENGYVYQSAACFQCHPRGDE